VLEKIDIGSKKKDIIMSNTINKVQLLGHLGNNPEIRYTPNGNCVATFSVATNNQWTDKGGQKQNQVQWHRIVVWNKLAEACGEYLSKGSQVFIEGRLEYRQWTDAAGEKRYSTEIVGKEVNFLSRGKNNNNNNQNKENKNNNNEKDNDDNDDNDGSYFDHEIPF
jgi:single-strand DNA-binding protein